MCIYVGKRRTDACKARAIKIDRSSVSSAAPKLAGWFHRRILRLSLSCFFQSSHRLFLFSSSPPPSPSLLFSCNSRAVDAAAMERPTYQRALHSPSERESERDTEKEEIVSDRALVKLARVHCPLACRYTTTLTDTRRQTQPRLPGTEKERERGLDRVYQHNNSSQLLCTSQSSQSANESFYSCCAF